MAIAPSKLRPSKLGECIQRLWVSDGRLMSALRELGLVKPDVSDDELLAVFRKARQEDKVAPDRPWYFNVLKERVRVYLEPYLSEKGREWAVLIKLPAASRKPWWRFW